MTEEIKPIQSQPIIPMNLHIIYTPFTGTGLSGGFRGNEWFKHRIEIFKNYTLKSLSNQSNKNFLYWISFRPEEKGHPLVDELYEHMKTVDLNYAFTFDGLMYHDDKFSDYSMKTKLRNFLMMLLACKRNRKMRPLKELWKHTWDNKNETLLARLDRSLEVFRGLLVKELPYYQWVYLTRIDSDDMFHKEAMALIQSQKPEYKRSLVFTDGYIYNINTGQLAEWKPTTNPPFHTITFPAYHFFDALSHKEYYGDFRTHEDATRVFNPIQMDMGKYMVLYHQKHIGTNWNEPIEKRLYRKLKRQKGYCYTTSGKNISTYWNSDSRGTLNPFIGKEFTNEEEKKEILKDFGIEN